MANRTARIPRYEPEHNVTLWLHRMNTERQLQNWSDLVAVDEACMSLGNVALTWFLTHCTRSTTWAEFDFGMRARFGDNQHTSMARIRHRRQAENENVQSYVDDMNMMFAQSVFPENLRRDVLLNNLKAGLREDVIATIPATVEQVIANAAYLQQKSVAVTPEKLNEWQQCMPSRQNAAEQLTRSLEKMSRCVANYWSRQEQQEPEPGASQYFTREDHRQYRDHRYNTTPRRWRSARYSHQELDCVDANNSSRNDIDEFLHSAPSEMDISCSSSAGCIPSTPEVLEYARSLDHIYRAKTVQAARLALQSAVQ